MVPAVLAHARSRSAIRGAEAIAMTSETFGSEALRWRGHHRRQLELLHELAKRG